MHHFSSLLLALALLCCPLAALSGAETNIPPVPPTPPVSAAPVSASAETPGATGDVARVAGSLVEGAVIVHRRNVTRVALGRENWLERKIARANTIEIAVDQNVHNAKILPSVAVGVGEGEGKRLAGGVAGSRGSSYRLGGPGRAQQSASGGKITAEYISFFILPVPKS